MSKISVFKEGMKDGIPIGLGYFAVAFSLGIAARNAGLTAFQALYLVCYVMLLLVNMQAIH